MSVGLLRTVFAAMDASFEALVRWRAGDVDRLLDVRHAAIVEAVARIVESVARSTSSSWQPHPEVTYAEYGERGSIDLLALRQTERAAAIFEIKSDLTTVESTIRKHGEKARLAPRIIERTWGWRPRYLARILVVEESMSARRVLARYATTFGAAYPATSRSVRRWLTEPTGDLAGVWFLSLKHRRAGSEPRGGSKRIRTAHRDQSEHAPASSTR